MLLRADPRNSHRRYRSRRWTATGPAGDALIPALAIEVEKTFSFDELDAAFARRRVRQPRAECERVIGELYQRIESRGMGIVLVFRAADDIPEMSQFVFQGRRDLLMKLESWIGRRQKAGHFLASLYPEFAARLVVESISWLAYKRFYDHDPPTDDAVAARETCVAMLVRALVGDAD